MLYTIAVLLILLWLLGLVSRRAGRRHRAAGCGKQEVADEYDLTRALAALVIFVAAAIAP